MRHILRKIEIPAIEARLDFDDQRVHLEHLAAAIGNLPHQARLLVAIRGNLLPRRSGSMSKLLLVSNSLGLGHWVAPYVVKR